MADSAKKISIPTKLGSELTVTNDYGRFELAIGKVATPTMVIRAAPDALREASGAPQVQERLRETLEAIQGLRTIPLGEKEALQRALVVLSKRLGSMAGADDLPALVARVEAGLATLDLRAKMEVDATYQDDFRAYAVSPSSYGSYASKYQDYFVPWVADDAAAILSAAGVSIARRWGVDSNGTAYSPGAINSELVNQVSFFPNLSAEGAPYQVSADGGCVIHAVDVVSANKKSGAADVHAFVARRVADGLGFVLDGRPGTTEAIAITRAQITLLGSKPTPGNPYLTTDTYALTLHGIDGSDSRWIYSLDRYGDGQVKSSRWDTAANAEANAGLSAPNGLRAFPGDERKFTATRDFGDEDSFWTAAGDAWKTAR